MTSVEHETARLWIGQAIELRGIAKRESVLRGALIGTIGMDCALCGKLMELKKLIDIWHARLLLQVQARAWSRQVLVSQSRVGLGSIVAR